jgi:ABC-type phosphate/phosphonate transport system substrate-binding protein/tetratricopeptide (TPR) repeat protein
MGEDAANFISFPMYDLPGVESATDRLHHAVCDALREPDKHGSSSSSSDSEHRPPLLGLMQLAAADAPHWRGPDRSQSAAACMWADPRLLLSQTCGQKLHDDGPSARLQPLATPTYTAPGCVGQSYCGLVLVRGDSVYTDLVQLAGARLAVNDFRSYSGCVGLRAAVAEALKLHGDGGAQRTTDNHCTRVNFFHPSVRVTGSHIGSVVALLRAEVDCVCIDCVTWAILNASSSGGLAAEPADPELLNIDQLRVIAQTPLAPAPPFVVSVDMGSDEMVLLFEALTRATAPADGSTHAPFERDLFLGSVSRADPDEYNQAFAALNRHAAPVAIDGLWDSGHGDFYSRLDQCGYRFDLAAPTVCGADESGQRSDAATWMDRGMLLVWAFNHAEAIKCFQHATNGAMACLQPHQEALDDAWSGWAAAAMAHWALGHAQCPNYNKPDMSAAELERARSHNRAALEMIGKAMDTPDCGTQADADATREPRNQYLRRCSMLINAQQVRLAKGASLGDTAVDDLSEAAFRQRDHAFARAMQGVYEADQQPYQPHYDSADVAAQSQASSAGRSASCVCPEIAALLVESLMQLERWNLWRDGTVELAQRIRRVCEGALGLPHLPHGAQSAVAHHRGIVAQAMLKCPTARHPGLAHFHVHLMEMAQGLPEPYHTDHMNGHALVERAVPSAQVLRSQWPACGHLVHMASHLDVHLGMFGQAVDCNQVAVAADRLYFDMLRTRDIYYHTYTLHCLNQLVWSAGFAGQSKVAFEAAEAILSTTPATLRARYADFVEPLFADIWFALVRFGKWDDILARPLPPLRGPVPDVGAVSNRNFVSVAISHWAKAIAAAALGRVALALQHRELFCVSAAAVPEDRHVHMVSSSLTLAVAAKMLDGEIAYRQAAAAATHKLAKPSQGQAEGAAPAGLVSDDPFETAFGLLREAAALEEAMPYDEPWGWMAPVAHALGALMLEQGRVHEAAEVYRRDLQRWPGNLWALHGLVSCLERQQSTPCCAAAAPAHHALAGGAGSARCGAEPTPVSDDGVVSTALELRHLRQELAVASARADISLEHSCFCAGLLPSAAMLA